MRLPAWDLAVECVDEALAAGVVPSLEQLGRLGQLGSLPSFIAALDEGDDARELAADFARERESLGLAPAEVTAELLTVARVLERHGEANARAVVDRCILAYVDRVTAELADCARRDPLTGLLNHGAFHTRLIAEASRARRYRGRLALVLFDLDHFKETNDRLGHQEGDRLLGPSPPPWPAPCARPTSRGASAATSSRRSCSRRGRATWTPSSSGCAPVFPPGCR